MSAQKTVSASLFVTRPLLGWARWSILINKLTSYLTLRSAIVINNNITSKISLYKSSLSWIWSEFVLHIMILWYTAILVIIYLYIHVLGLICILVFDVIILIKAILLLFAIKYAIMLGLIRICLNHLVYAHFILIFLNWYILLYCTLIKLI